MARFLREHHKPLEPRNAQKEKTYQLALLVMSHFFGPEWQMRHVTSFNERFLRTDTDKWTGDKLRELARAFVRMNSLAEMIINLQDVNGFEGCLELLADGRIEAGFAELEVGKILSGHGVKFRFRKRRNVAKQDYDLDVWFKNGRIGCADTKCLLETTKLSETSILDRLKKARGQLPDDVPGVIFVKLPENWTSDAQFAAMLNGAVEKFFNGFKAWPGTRSVVIVQAYTSFIEFGLGSIEPINRGLEFHNDNNGFGTTDWVLIGDAPDDGTPRLPIWWKILATFLYPHIDPRLFGYQGIRLT